METPQTLGTQPRVRGGGGLLNRITAANVTETQQRKTNSRAGGWRVEGGGSLAAEEYLRRDDGMEGGGPTSRTSGISVTHGFGWWMKTLLLQIYTASSRPPLLLLLLCFGTSPPLPPSPPSSLNGP